MRRRVFVCGLASAAAAPCLALAQDRAKVARIGYLGLAPAAGFAPRVEALRAGLRDLGYVEGRNVVIEYRWAEGQYERLAPLIAELAASKVDVIVTAGTPAALAVGRTAPSIPLVMVAVGDPIGTGLAASLARPGGNATGLTSLAPDLEGKRLELIREMLPNISRLAVFWNPANAYQLRDEKEVRAAADVLRIRVLPLAVRSAEELDGAFAAILAEGADAMLVLADRVFLHNRERIVGFAAKNRRPMMSAYRELAEDGGLMSFGPSYAVM